jgi:hypothetical protein
MQGAIGDPRTWRGASVRAAWRGLPPVLTGELFAARQDLAGRAPNAAGVVAPGLGGALDYRGAALVASGGRWLVPPARPAPEPAPAPDTGRAARRPVVGPRGAGAEVRIAGRLGASAGRLARAADADRGLAFAELSLGAGRSRGTASIGAALGGHVAAGRTGGAAWQRALATARVGAGAGGSALTLDGAYAAVNARAPAFERPVVGGPVPPLFDGALLSQRLAVPALPTGYRAGRQAAVARLAVGGAALTPYVSAVGGGDGGLRWARLAGLERRFDGPFAPFARLPRVRLVAGLAHVFDGALDGRTRGYLSATFTP